MSQQSEFYVVFQFLRSRRRVLATAFAMTLVSVLLACSGNTSSLVTSTTPVPPTGPTSASQAATFVYVAASIQGTSSSSNPPGGITGFQLSATGALMPIAGSPILFSSETPGKLAGDSKGHFLFAGGLNTILSYTINPNTGALTQAGSIAAGVGLCCGNGILVDPVGKFLYASTAGAVSVFAIASDGSLANVSTVSVNSRGAMAMDPAGKFFYVAGTDPSSTNTNIIAAFSVDSTTGQLAPVSSTTYSNGQITALTTDPAGKFLYVLATPLQTTTFSITNGSLRQIANVTCCLNDFGGNSILVHPSGKFLYETTQNGSGMLGWSIATDGSLGQLLPGFFTGSNLVQTPAAVLALSPDGGFLIAPEVNFNPGTTSVVAVFGVDASTGQLNEVPKSPFPTDAGSNLPTSVAVVRVASP